MGRNERPLTPGPLHDFARDLRELRAKTGMTYRALGHVAGYAPSALSAAASGDLLPTAEVLRAYVRACGGDADSWEERRSGLAAALRRTDAGPPPGPLPVPLAPEPAKAAGHADISPVQEPSLSPGGLSSLTAADPHQIGGIALAARLGAGAMGQGYLGRGARGDRVVVKTICDGLADDEGFRRRFRRELDALTKVRSPFILPVTDGDAAAARPWLATAYTPAVTLADAVGTCGPLPPEAVCQLAAAMAGALAAIHAAGIVHRDLKPSNVLLTTDGAQLLDFGIARAAEGIGLAVSGAHAGSAAFTSPEQACGSTAGPPADVFALGSLLAYALAGAPPFGEGRSEAVLHRIVHDPPDLAAVSALTSVNNNLDNLRELVGACLDKDPASRPAPADMPRRYLAASRIPAPGWLPAPVADRITRRDMAAAAALQDLGPADGPAGSQPGHSRRKTTRPLVLAPLILAGAIVITVTILRNTGSPPTFASPPATGPSFAGTAPATDTPATPGATIWASATGNSVQSSPAVAGGTVYIASNDRKVYALNAATGRVRWVRATGSYADSSPRVAGGTVYIGSWNHKVYALNAATGGIRWARATGSAIDSTPAVADGIVYVGSDDTRVYALDAATGQVRWARPTGGDVESSPAVAGGIVYVGSDDSKVFALDAATGRVRWARATGGDVQSSPAVAGGIVYVGSDDGRVYALDAATGRVRWTHATGSAVDSSPIVAGGTVYVGSEDHRVFALDAATGRVRWTHATGGYVDSSPAVASGTVFVGSDDGRVYALDAATGRVRWTRATGSFVESSPAVAGGTVYIGSNDGEVYALDAATGA